MERAAPATFCTNWFPSASLCLDHQSERGEKPASTCLGVNPQSPLSPLGICWRNSSSGEHRYTSIPPNTHGPALISSLNPLTLFKLHHKFMPVTLSMWGFWQEHHCICAWKSISSISFRKFILSRQSSLRMAGTLCPAERVQQMSDK